jgi:L-aspartate oxidase
MREARAPVVVVGSGIAGLSFSLKVSEFADVLLVTKKNRAASNTNWAQGGIAAVVGPDDETAFHVQDTLKAGAGLCHLDVVEAVIGEGPRRIQDLVEWGARFHREGGRLSLGKEGGHSRRRIVHAGDRTGRTIEAALLQAVEERPNIQVVEDLMVADLVVAVRGDSRRCAGITAVQRHTGEPVRIDADAVLLATGGSGQIYRHTTNPPIATGDGVAMAYRAGALIANMEFVQFHPTALFPTEDPAFLISEAVRGEGAILRAGDGRAFMDPLHPEGSLAPRDVVAREIHRVLRDTGEDHVTLDVSGIPETLFEERFPSTMEGCRSRQVDPFVDGIPVVPAAHYQCGGVWTDHHGATSLPGLFATGEVACTGLHGANRLASTSLLEGLVWGKRAAEHIGEELPSHPAGPAVEIPPWEDYGRIPPDPALISQDLSSIKHIMWNYVGLIRTTPRLRRAIRELRNLETEIEDFYRVTRITDEIIGLRNAVRTAIIVTMAAWVNKTSMGCHHRE